MYLTYFDDTGDTGQNYADPQQPIQGLCSVSIDEGKWRTVEQSCRAIVAKYFPEHADQFLISGNFEFHASAIYQGSGMFRNTMLPERLQLLDDIVEVVITHSLPIAGIYIQKNQAEALLEKYPGLQNLESYLFIMLYEALDNWITRCRGPERTILIGDIDSIKPRDAEALTNLYRAVTVKENAVLESVRFVESHGSFGIQLADTAAYLLRRGLTHPNRPIPAAERLLKWVKHMRVPEYPGILRFSGGWRSRRLRRLWQRL